MTPRRPSPLSTGRHWRALHTPDEAVSEVERYSGDPWAALRAALAANEQLERELEATRALVSRGYARLVPEGEALH